MARRTVSGVVKKASASGIDLDKLRVALRRLGDEYVFYILDALIDVVPPAELEKVVSGYIDVSQLRPDPRGKQSLLAEVRAFEAASRAGRYYESFNVNSRNCMDLSIGTRSFIADCHRLLDRCVADAPKGDAGEIRDAIELILGVLRYIDECHDDVIFFADEGGAWQVGVDWGKVLPALFICWSRTTEPAEYARRVVEVVEEFDEHDRVKQLAAAAQVGTAAQKKALRGMAARPSGPRRLTNAISRSKRRLL